MPHENLRVRRDLVLPGSELVETASRSGGPGGQHVNKTSTRVTLRWNASESAALSERQKQRLETRLARRLTRDGELVVHAGRYRSRARNRELARERLADLVRDALANRKRRVATRPSASSVKRRLTEKRRRGERKRERRTPRDAD